MNYPIKKQLALFRLNNGNSLIGKLIDSNDDYFEILNPALIIETIDENKNTTIDVVPAIQKHYIEDGASLDGISWLLDKSIVVVLSNDSFKLNSKILEVYNNIFNPPKTGESV